VHILVRNPGILHFFFMVLSALLDFMVYYSYGIIFMFFWYFLMILCMKKLIWHIFVAKRGE